MLITVLDADGKIPSGIFLGNLLWMGNYDECLSVHTSYVVNASEGFSGLYCISEWNISVPKSFSLPVQQLPIKTGLCLPDSCLAAAAKNASKYLTHIFEQKTVQDKYDAELKMTCTMDDAKLNHSAFIFLFLVNAYLCVVLLASFVTVFKSMRSIKKVLKNSVALIDATSADNKYSNFVNTEDLEASLELEFCEDDQNFSAYYEEKPECFQNQKCSCHWNKMLKFLKCFCLFSNAAKILDTSTSKKQFPCIHGIKFFSMTWVILGHTYIHNINVIENPLDLLHGIDNLPFQVVIQGTFSVDTFFFVGGFLLTYLYLKEAEKRNGKINWLALCLHRIIRITPVYLFLLGFNILIFKYLGSGPFWGEAANVTECKKNWWWNLLYINNFLPIDSMCLTWTWYLANDMQFFVLNSSLLYILWRWNYLGISIFFSLLVGSWSLTWYISYHYSILPLFYGISNATNYVDYKEKLVLGWNLIYSKPYCRIGPYFIGVFLAYILYQKGEKGKCIKLGVQILGWCLATSCALCVIYGLYHVPQNSILFHFYNALSRSAFSISVAWVIYCCVTGYGGIVNSVLSYNAWIPLSRVTYCVYLFHPTVMSWFFLSQKVPVYFTHANMVVYYLAFLFISYGIGFLISVTFEAPIINLEKLLRDK
ncbi:nose resistant to fluoxetine protein 6-like isoform X2 [Stegodyphus dumicola]|uniref:nose resistant to fluoxetine protein 6-like isoform X2 n=1 Tax=Stegodyphus dumicola TaxID=202533 RepID=UPI0015A8AE89|nr:nose resistant to fluoxetine protein 6-like isoform X2 [Stegodyphus dumicola]